MFTFLARGARRAFGLLLSTLALLQFFPQSALAQSAPYACPTPTSPSYAVAMLKLPDAWARTCGSAYVAALDWGVDVTNPQLTANLRKQFSRYFNYAGGAAALSPDDMFDITERVKGHGTHVSGLIAAAVNNSLSNSAGACPGCSLIMMAGTVPINGNALVAAYQSGAQVINMSFGNSQNQFPGTPLPPGACAWASETSTSITFSQNFCTALADAEARGVLLVAASGNFGQSQVNFPASHASVLAVGGVKPAVSGSLPAFWDSEPGLKDNNSSGPAITFGSNWGTQQQIAAPARNMPSTFPPNTIYHTYSDPEINCESLSPTIGKGHCTGTSMAAPLVSGIAGMVRSANPYLTPSGTRSLLVNRSENGDTKFPNGVPNAGQAVLAALANNTGTQTLDTSIKNRLVPLLSFHSADAEDHFYTVVPQMALAALTGTMAPLPKWRFLQGGSAFSTYDYTCPGACPNFLAPPSNVVLADSAGNPLPNTTYVVKMTWMFYDTHSVLVQGTNYGSGTTNGSGQVVDMMLGAIAPAPNSINGENHYEFQTVGTDPLFYDGIGTSSGITLPTCEFGPFPLYCSDGAVASVFTIRTNPLGGADLVPLYRMSWRCGETGSQAACAANPAHVSHAYTTDTTGIGAFQSVGYALDGIEGFIYPKTQSPQPAGTVKLCRLYSSAVDDYLLFTGVGDNGVTECGSITREGATYSTTVGGTDWIGYVLPVQAPMTYFQPGIPKSIAITGGGTQTTGVTSAFPTALTVVVKDGNGVPVNGVTVTFTAPGSGASLGSTPQTATTNASGIATKSVTANGTTGTYNVTASITGGFSTTFHLTNAIGSPAFFDTYSGVAQIWSTNLPAPYPLVMVVTDSGGNGIPNVPVTFSAPSSGPSASLSLTTVNTDSNGRASVNLTSNSIAGYFYITASIGGLPDVNNIMLTEDPIPFMSWVVGETDQSALINTQYPLALKVLVYDQFNIGLAGQTVTYTVVPSGAASVTLSSGTATTDSNGEAWVTATANGSTGVLQVTADTPSNDTITFNLTNKDEPSYAIVEGGFENPHGTTQSAALPASWTGTGNGVYTPTGLAANGGIAAPEGTQAGWFSTANGTLKQKVSTMAGSYTLSFKALAKSGTAAVPILVKLNGTQVGTVTPSNSAWGAFAVVIPHMPTGVNELSFSSLSGTSKNFIDQVSLARDASVSDFSNGSMESPVVTTTGAAPAGWAAGTTASNAYLTTAATANTVDGNQVILISSQAMKQRLVLEPGAYKVVFKAIMRSGQANTPLDVSVDGVVMASPTVTATWTEFEVPVLIGERGGYEFAMKPSATRATVIDNVRLVGNALGGLQIGGFESPVAPGGNGVGLGAPWTGSAAIINGNTILGSSWGLTAPEGVQAGRYTSVSGHIKQSVPMLSGSYTLTFKGLSQPGATISPIVVKLNGTQVKSITPTNTAWTQYSVVLPHAPTGNNEIQFTSTYNGTTVSLFIDDVVLVPTTAVEAFSNGSFEYPALVGLTGPGPTGWSGAQTVGVSYLSTLGLSYAPVDMQGTRADINQSVTLGAGFYEVTIYAAVRPVHPTATLKLYLDNVEVGAQAIAPSSSWTHVTFPVVIPVAGTYNFAFKNVTGSSGIYLDGAAINRD